MDIRVGHGIDVHQLAPKLPLILGGIKIDSSVGIKAHSDGDLVIHALVDAILGALALGDIGKFFPSKNKRWANANSNMFLLEAISKLNKHNYKISNVDINILLQKPKLTPYIPKIKKNLSTLLNITRNQLSIKATTTDKLGFIGNIKGIMSTATILIVLLK